MMQTLLVIRGHSAAEIAAIRDSIAGSDGIYIPQPNHRKPIVTVVSFYFFRRRFMEFAR
jgi:hypothetical protein